VGTALTGSSCIAVGDVNENDNVATLSF
jgi:hypothetical protein